MKWLGLIVVLCAAACEHGKGGGMVPTDGGSGAICGGFGGELCPPDEFCDFPRNSCGAADEAGTCRPRPTGCPDLFQPTCGCDGDVHGNSCEANAAGVDVSDIGSCPTTSDQFTCGHLFCDVDNEYCQRSGSDVGGEPDGFQCNPLPNGCSSGPEPECACLIGEPCGDNCLGDGATGLEATCFGG